MSLIPGGYPIESKKASIASIIMALSLMLTLVAGAVAQEKFALTPIVLEDAGEKIEISIDDIAKYHGHLCPCSGIAFRAARFGISKLWGSEIPEREDIEIISHLPTVGSADCFSYITGTGPAVPHKSEGEFNLILPDGTEVTNYSPKNLKPISKDMTIDNWNFVIVRKSTGERFEVWVKENVFSENRFFELRKKVKFTKIATDEEKKQFQSMMGKIVDTVKTQSDDKLFEGKLVAKIKGKITKVILIYGSTTGNTETLAGGVVKGLEKGGVEVIVKNVVEADVNELAEYDLIVFGCSTWWEGELQDDFVDFYNEMDNISLAGKKSAVFGPGDKKNYPDTFCKAVDILEDRLKECGAEIVIESLKIDGWIDESAMEKAELWGEKLQLSLTYESIR